MANAVLLEGRSFRPFKSSEEYLYAMKEDLAEWLHTLYPETGFNVDNFMDRIDTGVILCKHANNVKKAAAEYVARKQARKMMTRSTTTSLAVPISIMAEVPYLPTAKPGTFFARDNVSNFIMWCRKYLGIFECLLFETDDLILRKNEKHVILCLLEVARKGAKFGMLAPMLVQMERQIDREIAQEQRGTIGDTVNLESDSEDEIEQPPVIMVYGPQPQIVTNDLKSLDEMVRDLVEKCSCPVQFPMIRVSEGKYRIGDTKVLIFVRILRNHVMVRVGGGWDTLSHYLDKHDPCRCRSQHRTALQSRLINRPGAADLNGAQVFYERSPPRTRRSSISSVCSNGHVPIPPPPPPPQHLLLPTVSSRNRSRSPTPSRKHSTTINDHNRRSVSPSPNKMKVKSKTLTIPNRSMRSRSPTPSLFAQDRHVATMKINPEARNSENHISEATLQILDTTVVNGETCSDNGSEISDEGYRSLGLIQNQDGKLSNKINRLSLNSQNSYDDADFTENASQHNSDSGSTIGEKPTPANAILDETNETGLRKTYFSDTFYNDKKIDNQPKKNTLYRSNSHDKINGIDSPSIQRTFQYKSLRYPKPPSPQTRTSIAKPKTPVLRNKVQDRQSLNNTWNGRQTKSRPTLSNDTYVAPVRTESPSNFSRKQVGRSSLAANRSQYDSNGRKLRIQQQAAAPPTTGNTKSPPTKSKSPLLEQIIKSAENSMDDAQMLEKIKDVLKQYSYLTDKDNLDFTSAWVKSQSENQQQQRKSSATSDGLRSTSSSAESTTNGSKNICPFAVVSPRKDTKVEVVGKASRIPTPAFKRALTDL